MIAFEGRRNASEGGPGKITVPCGISLSGESVASSFPVSALKWYVTVLTVS